MVDAVSGAIYVIGGLGSTTDYNDVWVSTDGGARAGLGRGAVGGVHWVGTTRGTKGVLRTLKGTAEVLQGYCRGTAGVLQGVLRGTTGGTRGYEGGTRG